MRKAAAIALLFLAAVPLLLAVTNLPPQGSMDNPSYTHVVPRYLEHGAEETGAENIVTAIILNYRGYDTTGEVTVIFTACMGVLAVLLVPKAERPGRPRKETPTSPVVRFIVSVTAPFVFVFSLYVILYGHATPGGGFQGGTILGALIILASLVLGIERVSGWLPAKARDWLQPAAVLTFVAVGTMGLVLVGFFLEYPRDPSLAWLRTTWLQLLEIGIGVGGAVIFASIFWTMQEET